jgi:hypothetical protein
MLNADGKSPFGLATPSTIRFRSEALEEIATLLGGTTSVSLDLLEYSPGEDFGEGVLMFRQIPLGVYYEYSLGNLSLMHPERSVLETLASKVGPSVRLR